MMLFRSGDIVVRRRLSSEERRRPNALEEYRKLTDFISSSGTSLGSDYQRWLSKSDTWSRYPAHHRSVGGAEGGDTDKLWAEPRAEPRNAVGGERCLSRLYWR